MSIARFFMLGGLCVVLTSLGCGGGGDESPKASAQGKVTLGGDPVECSVTFVSKELGTVFTTEANDQGEFKFEDMIDVGTYTVVISSPQITQAPESPEDMKLAEDQRKKSEIPAGYSDEGKSGLTANVEEGKENQFTFDLKTSGP